MGSFYEFSNFVQPSRYKIFLEVLQGVLRHLDQRPGQGIYCGDMDDDAFLDAFEHGRLQQHGFGHRDHLRVAWLYVRRYGRDEAVRRAEAGLRALATWHGHPERFPRLLDGRLLDAHYSPELLATAASRSRPVDPDRLPLPATAS